MLLGRTISLNEATATASPVRAGGQRITSSEVYAWTVSAKGKILWADFVEDAEDPEPQFEGPQNCRVRALVGCMLGLLTSRRGGL